MSSLLSKISDMVRRQQEMTDKASEQKAAADAKLKAAQDLSEKLSALEQERNTVLAKRDAYLVYLDDVAQCIASYREGNIQFLTGRSIKAEDVFDRLGIARTFRTYEELQTSTAILNDKPRILQGFLDTLSAIDADIETASKEAESI